MTAEMVDALEARIDDSDRAHRDAHRVRRARPEPQGRGPRRGPDGGAPGRADWPSAPRADVRASRRSRRPLPQPALGPALDDGPLAGGRRAPIVPASPADGRCRVTAETADGASDRGGGRPVVPRGRGRPSWVGRCSPSSKAWPLPDGAGATSRVPRCRRAGLRRQGRPGPRAHAARRGRPRGPARDGHGATLDTTRGAAPAPRSCAAAAEAPVCRASCCPGPPRRRRCRSTSVPAVTEGAVAGGVRFDELTAALDARPRVDSCRSWCPTADVATATTGGGPGPHAGSSPARCGVRPVTSSTPRPATSRRAGWPSGRAAHLAGPPGVTRRGVGRGADRRRAAGRACSGSAGVRPSRPAWSAPTTEPASRAGSTGTLAHVVLVGKGVTFDSGGIVAQDARRHDRR